MAEEKETNGSLIINKEGKVDWEAGIANNTLQQTEIEHVCSFHEGTAIQFDIHGTEDNNGNKHTINFSFHSFFDNLESTQF